MSKIMHIDC